MCCFVLDEMHMQEGFMHDKHEGELIGLTNMGNVNNHLAAHILYKTGLELVHKVLNLSFLEKRNCFSSQAIVVSQN